VRTCEGLGLTYSHEVFDDTVELGAFVTETKLGPVLLDSRGQSTEVLCGLGNGLQNCVI
jgi:hypothetical protein